MKMNKLFLGLLLGTAVFLSGCKEDEPVPLTLDAIVAGTIDLNTATAPTGVPVDAAITVTFSTDVDTATAKSANITLTQDYDDADIAMDIEAVGKVITLTPKTNLGNGALYILDFSAGLLSTDGLALTSVSRSFTTEGTFAPAGAIAHWNFENNAEDQVGSYDASAAIAVTYTDSRNAAAGKAATFDGDASIIEIPNGDQLINTQNFTLSFWVKTNSTHDAGHFVLGLGAFKGIQFEIFGAYDGAKFAIQYEMADGTTNSEDMWFPKDAQSKDNGGFQGWDFAKAIPEADMIAMLKDKWLNVVYTYDGVDKKATLYYNGEKMKSFDFDLWDEIDPKHGVKGMKWGGDGVEVVNELAFGFIQSRAGTLWDTEAWGGYDFPGANHFKGQLDDVRIYHKAITANEILLMYNSEKP
ncbi:MAG: hypothetical protein A2Y87_04510 [Bacteroidetes bacterium RBG_13_46_8]|nr:MAG: hypothetical protein A2Y87_04510 [Bacteroidetes bacterium RBG_13_46_8]